MKPLTDAWTETEKETLIQALHEHGKDYVKLQQAVATKTQEQVRSHAKILWRELRNNKDHPLIHLLPSFEENKPDRWTEKEH